MRKFFETPDGKLLEIDSPLSLTKSNLKEYSIRTSNDSEEIYMPVITKTDRGYSVKVNLKEKNAENGLADDCCELAEESYLDRVIFIELDTDNLRMKRYIAENEKPEVSFFVPHGKVVKAYAYSLKGGLWMSTLKEDEVK